MSIQKHGGVILVTGGLGFMGSHFIRRLYAAYPDYRIVNLDLCTYAANLENLEEVEKAEQSLPQEGRRYDFVKGDICDVEFVNLLFKKYSFAQVVHFAAETHVDRSLFNFSDFVRTNIEGTRVLLEAVHAHQVPRMVHISTDEVYGNVKDGFTDENAPFRPSSPYSASKASGDMLAQTYASVYGTPLVTLRSSNNYGTHQYPEKLMPLVITNLLEGIPIPVHGTGEHVRSWLHVDDFCTAVDLLMHQAPVGGIYNVAGEHRTNIANIEMIAKHLGKEHREHVSFVGDRPAADLRYAPDASKIERELGWKRTRSIDEDFPKIIDWYRDNESWWKKIKAKKEFADHYEKQANPKDSY